MAIHMDQSAERLREEGVREGLRRAAAVCEVAATNLEGGRKRVPQMDAHAADCMRRLAARILAEDTAALVEAADAR